MVSSVLWRAVLCATVSACSLGPPMQGTDPVVSRPGFSSLSGAVSGGAHGRIRAVIVDQAGEILFERYWHGATPKSRIDARSAGKSITALALAIALDEGAVETLDLEALGIVAGRNAIANDGPSKRAITLRDLLTMSSALDCDDWDRSSPGNEERMYDTRNWTRFALGIPADPDYQRNEEGQGRFSYCTAGVFLLGRVLEKKTGVRFDNYVESRLFEPLGITGALWTRSPAGEVQSGGQLRLRARDFRRLGRLVLDGGIIDGRRLISRDSLKTLLRPRLAATPDKSYGYLWWFRNFSRPDKRQLSAAMMSGNGGNMIVLFPEIDTVITILATNYNRADSADNSHALIEDHILPALPAGTKADLFRHARRDQNLARQPSGALPR